ncbi:MAG: TldD/PmbA family protein [Promethearchaeati archaeon SRVP18_Atabeyarchaeia-1]
MDSIRHLLSQASSGNVELEIFLLKRDLISVRFSGNEIVEAQNTLEEGTGIRLVRDGRLGFALTNNLSPDALDKSFRSALAMAKTSSKIPNWHGLPQGQDHGADANGERTQDNGSEAMTSEETINRALRMIKEVTSSNGDLTLTGVLITVHEEFSILNSNGLDHLLEPSSIIYSRLILETRRGERYSSITSQFCSRRLSDFNPEKEVHEVISSASKLARLQRIEVPRGKRDVILSPESAGAFTCYLIGPMITGKSVQVGASCLTNMTNKRVASESFSLIDNGRAPGGLASAEVDDEGTPTRLTKVVERGVLKTFLNDTLSASLNETDTTANARRASDTLGRTYMTPPEPLPTNLIVEKGNHSLDELVEATKTGIIINSIGYTFHLVPELGYFNIVSNSPALVVENGKIKGYAQNTAFTGKLVETLMNIDGIGKDVRQSASLGSMVCFSPYLRIRDADVERAK